MARSFTLKFLTLLTFLLLGCGTPVFAQKTESLPPITLDPSRVPIEHDDTLLVAQRSPLGDIFTMSLAEISWPQLKEGHTRYSSQSSLNQGDTWPTQRTREIFAKGHPARICVVQCSDERVAPAHVLYDLPQGSVFSIRTAGNNILGDGDGRASYDFCMQSLNTHIVLVLGHYNCGAMKLALKSVKSGQGNPSKAITKMMKFFGPIAGASLKKEDPLKYVVELNVLWQVSDLAWNEALLSEEILRRANFMLVGAVYDHETGQIRYLKEFSGRDLLLSRKKTPDLVIDSQTTPTWIEENTRLSRERLIAKEIGTWPEEFLEHGGRKWLEAASPKAKPNSLEAGYKKDESSDSTHSEHGHRD